MNIYRHYKGGYYAELGFVHSEDSIPKEGCEFDIKIIATYESTMKPVEVLLTKTDQFGERRMYSSLDKNCILYQDAKGTVWLRPFVDFIETIEVDGELVERFKHIGTFGFGGLL